MKLTLLLLILTNIAFSHPSVMVMMMENGQEKQIGLSTDGQTLTALTSGDDWHLYPTISSDGKIVAYVKGSSPQDLRLVTHDLQTGATLSLTEPGFILHPNFSKRDSRLSFSILHEGKQKIAHIDFGLSNSISYIELASDAYFPIPFQNFERIIYQRNANGIREIVLLNTTDLNEEVIAEGMSPTLSKDERYIAYTKNHQGNWDIWVYDRFLGTHLQATTHSARDFAPVFDKKGELLYSSDRTNDSFSIYKQSFESWRGSREVEELIFDSKSHSLYAAKLSGSPAYELSFLANMSGEARSSFGVTNHRDFLYVAGGHIGPEHTYPPESFSDYFARYDISTDSWQELAPRPHKGHGYMIVGHEDSLYAFGGFAYDANNSPSWKSLNAVDRYNIATNTWETIGVMPRRRSSYTLATVNNKVYLFGGWDATPKFENDIDGTFHAEIDVFDLETETWETMATELPLKRRAFSSFEKDGMIYLVGGISEGGSHFSLLKNFTRFNPSTETFFEMPELPFGTFAPATGVLQGNAYMFGGMFNTGPWQYEYIPHVIEFNFSKNIWFHVGRYLSEYKGFSQVAPVSDCLAILGGHTYDGHTDEPVTTVEKICKK